MYFPCVCLITIKLYKGAFYFGGVIILIFLLFFSHHLVRYVESVLWFPIQFFRRKIAAVYIKVWEVLSLVKHGSASVRTDVSMRYGCCQLLFPQYDLCCLCGVTEHFYFPCSHAEWLSGITEDIRRNGKHKSFWRRRSLQCQYQLVLGECFLSFPYKSFICNFRGIKWTNKFLFAFYSLAIERNLKL